MPPVVLQDARRVVGDDRLEFHLQDNPCGFAENATATIRAINHRLEQACRRGGLNAYYLKRFVGDIAILPAYLYQSMGEMISKAAAIRRAEATYSPSGYKAVEWATMVRQEFDICVKNHRMRALQGCATHGACRRQQAEQLFKRFSIWINNEHKLGLNQKVRECIRTFARESESLNTVASTSCK
jgi:hypothetical protein